VRFLTCVGEGPATRVGLSLPEGTAAAIRRRVGKREFSAFITEAVERELRGQILDEYLADCERRQGPISEDGQERVRRVFDEVFAEEGREARVTPAWLGVPVRRVGEDHFRATVAGCAAAVLGRAGPGTVH
jgi:hypothetical protein